MKQYLSLGAICALVSILMTYSVAASESDESDWKFRVNPYVWALSTNGEVGLGTAPDAEVDLDIYNDVLPALDFMLFGPTIGVQYSF